MTVEWHPDFAPSYTPEEMLRLGVFEGKYINIIEGIPAAWKKLPKVVGPKDDPDVKLNHDNLFLHGKRMVGSTLTKVDGFIGIVFIT